MRPAESPPDSVDAIEAAWVRERPDIDVSSIGIVTRLWRIARHLENQRQEQLVDHDTDRGMLDVLAQLRRAGAPYMRSAGELKDASLISSGGLSQRLERLEKVELITRSVRKSDRRIVDVQLTRKGLELVDSIVADLMAHDSALLVDLSELEREQLRGLLRKLLRQFEG
jgi:DNA-binding MarR family transcriptional regulator